MTTTPRLLSAMMSNFIHHKRSESARWWGTVWGIQAARVYGIAYRHGCKEAIAKGGERVPACGTLPTQPEKYGRKLRISPKILKAAGLMGLERMSYRIEPGRVIIERE